MKFIVALLLLAAPLAAQQRGITPSQIQPGSNGQVITTQGGVTGWGSPTGASGDFAIGGKATSGASFPSNYFLTTMFGDSLTVGYGENLYCSPTTGCGTPWPSQLQTTTGLPSMVLAWPGINSASIALHANGYAGQTQQTFAASFTVTAGATCSSAITWQTGIFPAISITNPTPFGLPVGSYWAKGVPISFTVAGTTYTGTIGVDGTGGPCGSGNGFFFPVTPLASTLTVPSGTAFTMPITNQANGCVTIWSGRNNIIPGSGGNETAILADIDAAVQSVKQTTACWAVISIINSEAEPSGSTDYNLIQAINAQVLATYGAAHYIDIRSQLVAAYNPATPIDAYDHAHDIPPGSLRTSLASATTPAAITSTTTCAITFGGYGGSGGVSAWSVVEIDTEDILITGGTEGAYTCIRGYTSAYGGSAGATHASGTHWFAIDQEHPAKNPLSDANPNANDGGTIIARGVAAWLLPATSTLTSKSAVGQMVNNLAAQVPTLSGSNQFTGPNTFKTVTADTVNVGDNLAGGATAAVRITAPGWASWSTKTQGTTPDAGTGSGDYTVGIDGIGAYLDLVHGSGLSGGSWLFQGQMYNGATRTNQTVICTPGNGYCAGGSQLISGFEDGAGGGAITGGNTWVFPLTGNATQPASTGDIPSGTLTYFSHQTIVSNYLANASVDIGAGATDVITVYKNNAATAITCTITGNGSTGTTCSDNTHTVVFAAGDSGFVKVVVSSTAAAHWLQNSLWSTGN